MKVKFLTAIAGFDVSYGHGEIVEADEKVLKRFVEAGIAEEIKEPVVEVAVEKPKRGKKSE